MWVRSVSLVVLLCCVSFGVLAMDGPPGVGGDSLSTTAVSGASDVRLTSAAVSERFPLGPEWGRGEVLSSLTAFQPVDDEGMDLCHGAGIDDRGHPATASLTQVTQKETVGGWAAAYSGPDEARDALHQAHRAALRCPLKDGRPPVLKASPQSGWAEFSFLTTYTRLSDPTPTADVNTAVTVRQSGNVATATVYQHQGASDAVLRSGARRAAALLSSALDGRRPALVVPMRFSVNSYPEAWTPDERLRVVCGIVQPRTVAELVQAPSQFRHIYREGNIAHCSQGLIPGEATWVDVAVQDADTVGAPPPWSKGQRPLAGASGTATVNRDGTRMSLWAWDYWISIVILDGEGVSEHVWKDVADAARAPFESSG